MVKLRSWHFLVWWSIKTCFFNLSLGSAVSLLVGMTMFLVPVPSWKKNQLLSVMFLLIHALVQRYICLIQNLATVHPVLFQSVNFWGNLLSNCGVHCWHGFQFTNINDGILYQFLLWTRGGAETNTGVIAWRKGPLISKPMFFYSCLCKYFCLCHTGLVAPRLHFILHIFNIYIYMSLLQPYLQMFCTQIYFFTFLSSIHRLFQPHHVNGQRTSHDFRP